MGFDELTAVYDISASTVYMPSGLKLDPPISWPVNVAPLPQMQTEIF